MNIAVIGTGYVGLVTGTCFAETGNNVICVDINEQKVKSLKAGKIPIFEPGLEDMVIRNNKAARINFTLSAEEGLQNVDVIFVAVATPEGEDGRADLKYVEMVAHTVKDLWKNQSRMILRQSAFR